MAVGLDYVVPAAGNPAPYTSNAQNKNVGTTPVQHSVTQNQDYWDVRAGQFASPVFADAAQMNAGYGMNIDQNAYQGMLDSATRSTYGAARGELAGYENQQYGMMGQNVNTYMDQMRRLQAQATMTGMSKGASAAAQLSTMLGLGQQNAALATELANSREQTILDERAELAGNPALAAQYIDSNKNTLLGHAISRYDIDNNMLGTAYTAATAGDAQRYYADAYRDVGLAQAAAAAASGGSSSPGGSASSDSPAAGVAADTATGAASSAVGKGTTKVTKAAAAAALLPNYGANYLINKYGYTPPAGYNPAVAK
jgi:hypothetical protein